MNQVSTALPVWSTFRVWTAAVRASPSTLPTFNAAMAASCAAKSALQADEQSSSTCVRCGRLHRYGSARCRGSSGLL
jgi:hypothetical protein